MVDIMQDLFYLQVIFIIVAALSGLMAGFLIGFIVGRADERQRHKEHPES